MSGVAEARPWLATAPLVAEAAFGLAAARAYAGHVAARLVEDGEIPRIGVVEVPLPDLRDLQATAIERELSRLALEPRTFVVMRAEAKLSDLGARPALTERAADEVDRLALILRAAGDPRAGR